MKLVDAADERLPGSILSGRYIKDRHTMSA
jgi:hypothetical protein